MTLDIKEVDKWVAPSKDDDPVKVLSMPNVPKPLHLRPPRSVLGQSTWDRMRKRCYYDAGYKCEACGAEPEKGKLHCLEKGTEVLTLKGFKPIEDITTDDVVAQYGPRDNGISWVKPTSTVVTKVDKVVKIGYKNRFVVGYSDKHRVLLKKAYNGVTTYIDKHPEDIAFSYKYSIPTAGKSAYIGRGLSALERVYIAVNADGCIEGQQQSGEYEVYFRVKKDRKAERIVSLLDEAKIHYSITNEKRESYRGYWFKLRENPKDFWDVFSLNTMSYQYAVEFIDELTKWDGWKGLRSNGSGKKYPGRCWYTTKKSQSDFVQAVATLANITTTVSITNRPIREWGKHMPNRKDSVNCLPQIAVEFLNRDSRGIQTMKRNVEYTPQDMYCITVPSTYFVARSKDNYVFITGNCHELYSIDYVNCTSKFERCVALCTTCHTEPGVHTGRAYTMYHQGNVLMPKRKLLDGVEHIFKQVYEYNTKRKPEDEEDLRLFAAFVQYAKDKTLREEMLALIDKYNIKFYKPSTDYETARWSDWRLLLGNREYEPKFKSMAEWEEAMSHNVRQGREKSAEEKEVDSLWEVL